MRWKSGPCPAIIWKILLLLGTVIKTVRKKHPESVVFYCMVQQSGKKDNQNPMKFSKEVIDYGGVLSKKYWLKSKCYILKID